jgi:hypothetical protein
MYVLFYRKISVKYISRVIVTNGKTVKGGT